MASLKDPRGARPRTGGSICLIRAGRGGDQLHWTMVDAIREPQRDIDILAYDDV